jgi:hypothetical protein
MNERDTLQRKWPADLESLDRPATERVPRAERSQVMWSWVAVIAMVFVLGVTFYAIDARQDQRNASQSTASSTATAPSTSATAGQTPVGETTGQGVSDDVRRTGDEAER